MPIESRKQGTLGTPGPFLAEITNHLDTTFMGRLEVALIKGVSNVTDAKGETYIVNYLSPFAGNTSVRFEGPDPKNFNDVQKSYGFWMIPPDVGTRVMVIFIDGDPNKGYWFGCIVDKFQNHMIPGISATDKVHITEEQRRQYGTSYLPTAEFHKSSQKVESPSVNSIFKPIHPFADRLLQQGLLLDSIRGVTSSSARREVPSSVFGISTPGPIDTSQGSRKGQIGYKNEKIEIPVSRLGGTTFVMDDGDTEGQNELVRLRTRTGHQILLHNSQDLIYIANSQGTAWIELTSNGKIDIFAQDSVSIHSEQDFNFRADRDINFEAGRNLNIKVNKNMETNVTGYSFIIIGEDNKIHVSGDSHLNVNGSIFQTSGSTNETNAGGNIIETGPEIHMNGPTAQTAEIPPELPLFSLPNRKESAGWINSNFYKLDDLKSIMQRVPTHEPWPQHENVNPVQFSAQSTDVTLADRTKDGIAPNPVSSAGIISPSDAAGTAQTPEQTQQQGQQPANQPIVSSGTCNPLYAKDINSSASQSGIAAIKAACAKYGLTSPYAVAALLGIAGGECRWRLVEESFNYRADRLLQVFPSVFKGNKSLALQYAGNPNNSLPEFLYGYNTRKGKGLGNIDPGDGAKYIGRGYIQLTGRSNYYKYGNLIGKDLISNPTLLNDPEVAAEVSVKYLLDRCKLDQNDPGYFEAACKAVGYNTADIKAKKQGYYECFLNQLSGGIVGTGTGGILTDSSGNPIKTGN